MTQILRPTWVEIDAEAFARNVAAVQAKLPEGSRLIAVLKANAYGHGAVPLARRIASGPEAPAMIAVSLLEEALELRGAGIELPLLVLGPLGEEQVAIAATERITVGVPGPEVLRAAASVARDRDVTVHLKLDSGMGRMGVVEEELADVVDIIRGSPRLKVEAIYTHLATADDARYPMAEEQVARFRTLVETLREAGVEAPLHHVSNSAGTMRGLVAPGDFVRTGIALYGAETLATGGSRLEPVMRWRTEIARLKELPPGHAIGYGATFQTTRPSRIATLPVGYADGYNRLLSNRGDVLMRGRRAAVVGRVSMDLVTIDVTDIPDATLGDEVILLGKQGDEEITADALAALLGTISYEVFCSVSARVPRVLTSSAR